MTALAAFCVCTRFAYTNGYIGFLSRQKEMPDLDLSTARSIDHNNE